MNLLRKLPIDGYSILLLATVALAAAMPAQGGAASALAYLTTGAITLLFFLHGARLSRQAVIAGATHWRLHLLVFSCTFILFPILGLGMSAAFGRFLDPMLMTGIVFLTLLPSTVQSSIAFTAMAGGNVTAAVCSAATSNLAGTLLTPVLVALFLGIQGHEGDILPVVRTIALQLLVPFAAGQLLQPRLGGWIGKHRALVTATDRGAILLVVYTAFSAAIVEGLFTRIAPSDLWLTLQLCVLLLALILGISHFAASALGFSRPDRIAILFCGSKKSLASGVPIATALFPVATVGYVILPLMIFHQIQLLVCAFLAGRMRQHSEIEPATTLQA